VNQHDVLFENLSVEDHIIFFSQLKGTPYEAAKAEVRDLTHRFHLDERLLHLGSELSGGQKRKLSVSDMRGEEMRGESLLG
jgi:ABC-type multidrug transport system ATPase subunit